MTDEVITFNKKLEELRENGEADIRIDLLVNSLNIETKFRRLCQSETINKDYGELFCNLDYLDCVGLDVGITMKPFNQYIEPFDGRRVNDFLGWMKDCAKVLGKTRSTQWGSVSSILFAIYAKKAILEFKPKELPGILDYSMRCAMENENYLLPFEIVRTNVFNHVIQLQRIFKDTKGVSPLIIDTILQTSRQMILREFPNLKNNAIVLSFCWECGQGILNRMVMIMSYKGSIEITDRIPNEIMGFKLVLYNLAHLSDEAENVFKSIPVSKKTPLPTVTESEKLCISLFCFHKGYIPFGEERFPKQLGEFEVDVQEGYSVLGSGASLEIGGYICRAGCGSIGGFVDLPNNKTGLITCAHVIFSSKELEELESNGIPPGIEVKAFDRTAHTYKVCGTCVAAEFPKCFQQATSPQPNVDAALIKLDPVIDTFRLRTVSSDQLYSTGFDPDNPPVFSGEVVPLSDPDPMHRICQRIPDKLDSVVKYGVETGLTIGDLYHSGVHVRLISDTLKLPDSSRSAIMCDQIEIQNFPQGQFFECGDSGSFVFCINPDKILSCLGMAVGLSLPQKTCLVTPIDRILRSVCPPGSCLKPCSSLFDQNRTNTPPQATLDMILAAIGNFQTSLQSVETNFQASLQTVERNVERNFQTSLQNVETNFQASLQNAERNLQASLQSTETNFQASLQNVQTEVRTLQSQVQQTEYSKTRTSSDQSNANQN
ncbi:uncharacterized protein LOC130050717 [Ostrea edulis]|uniref:uncharacterized protein LOC130050717 n=1 Tax=Ostrea edulis TaxID=37623 RepID=UPI0024AF9365|nr:uncharacterized protein LOC130050717 [Ostrea edulis]